MTLSAAITTVLALLLGFLSGALLLWWRLRGGD
jgi:hypothetical protein